MKKINILILLNLATLLLFSCGVVKEGFTNQKKNSSDEFLVEKKSPLAMPPDFDEIPSPGNENKETKLKENSFKDLINEDNNSGNSYETTSNLEGSILGKIKSN